MIAETFDKNRLRKLILKHFRENKHQLLNTWLLTFTTIILFYVLLISVNESLFIQLNKGDSFLIFNTVLFGGGIIFAERQLKFINAHGDSWFYFILPASQLEKTLVPLIFSTLAYALICVTGFYVAAYCVEFCLAPKAAITPMNIFAGQFFYVFPLFFTVQQITLLCVLTFDKYRFAKIIILFLTLWILIKLMPYDLMWFISMGHLRVNENSLSLTAFTHMKTYSILIVVTNLLLFMSTYKRFRLKVIKNN